jgi:thiol-disulfide isomerase/thioredoxin
MISRRHLIATAAVLAFAASSPALAAEKKKFTAAEFEAAQKAGKSILVEVHAPWCPTCKAQAPILSELMKDAKFNNLVVFMIDFDSQKDAVQKVGARMQSTLVAYKGTKETARSAGDTRRESIAALVNSAI